MGTQHNNSITVEVQIDLPVEKVWQYWSLPAHIIKWCQASDDWYAPYAENDLQPGGKFMTRMASRDGKEQFDWDGTYTAVIRNKLIEYTMSDGRKVSVHFLPEGNRTKIVETFDPEEINSRELQKEGWQAILNNFKKYSESLGGKEILHFEIEIIASPDVVYKKMLDRAAWDRWTSAFAPGSRYEGTWEKGSRILFLGEDEKGQTGGMVSRIRENIPSRFISIEHLGIIQDGREITSGKEVEEWAGSLENYTFKPNNGSTLLMIDTESNAEFTPFFEETWPRALEILKDICEQNKD